MQDERHQLPQDRGQRYPQPMPQVGMAGENQAAEQTSRSALRVPDIN